MKIFLAFVLCGILAWRFALFYQEKPVYTDGQEIVLRSALHEEPELSNKGQKFSVKDSFNQRIYVTAVAFPRLHYGQVIMLHGALNERELEDGRVLFSMYQPEITVITASEGMIAGWANGLREHSKLLFEGILPPVPASLLMGIVFGAKEHFPDSFFDALQVTGVLHVIAASGMNVTFVSAGLLFGLSHFMRRQFALIAGCLGIVFYLFLVGFEPSIVRASLMALLAFGASVLGRQHIAAYALVVSAYVMLVYQPGFLFDLGFQLSFTATLGILFVKPLFPFHQNFFTESIATTLAAQIGTLPLLLGVFGQVGVLSLLVNALVLWIVPIVMLLGSVAVIIGLFFEPVAQLLLLLSLPFLGYFENIVTFFGNSNWIVHIPKLPVGVWIGYYLFGIAFILLRKPKLQTETRHSLLSDL